MKRVIDLSSKERSSVTKAFGCSKMSVWRALNYRDNSLQSQKIRNLALKKGGIVLNIAPQCETIHDAEGYMRQYFDNGCMIEVDKKTGEGVMTDKNGTVLEHVPYGLTVQHLSEMQSAAMAI